MDSEAKVIPYDGSGKELEVKVKDWINKKTLLIIMGNGTVTKKGVGGIWRKCKNLAEYETWANKQICEYYNLVVRHKRQCFPNDVHEETKDFFFEGISRTIADIFPSLDSGNHQHSISQLWEILFDERLDWNYFNWYTWVYKNDN
jgi:hypothetical protein